MKRIPLFALLLLLGSSAFLAACDFNAASDAFDDFNIIIGIENQKTAVVVQLFDARTGDFVNRPATIEFGGDASLFVDTYGDPLARLRTTSGQAGFSISDARMPTSASPATFEVSINAEGYLPLTQSVVLSDTGAYKLAFNLVNPSAPPTGAVTSRETTPTNAQGQTPNRTVVTPPPTAQTPAAGADLPAGTTMSLSSGQPATGTVNLDLVTIDPENTSAMQSLPRSRAALRKANDLNLEDFLIFGALTLDLRTAQGLTVAAARAPVGQNIDLEIVLPVALVDPTTNLPLPSGTTFVVGRFNPTTFTYENFGQATYNGPGQGGAQKISILIRRNEVLAGTYVVLAPVTNFENVTVNITRNGHQNITTTFGQAFVLPFSFSFPNSTAPTFTITRRMPSPGRGTRAVVVASSEVVQVQSGPSTTFNFTLPTRSNPNITYRMNLQCPAGQGVYLTNLPSLTISFREVGTSRWFSLGDISRNAGLSIIRERQGDVTSRILAVQFVTNVLVQGRTYDLEGVYNGTDNYRERHTINTNPFTLNWDAGAVCR